MARWANYNGSLDTPIIRFYEEECIYVRTEEGLVPVSSMKVAEKEATYCRSQGQQAEIVKRMESRSYEIKH